MRLCQFILLSKKSFTISLQNNLFFLSTNKVQTFRVAKCSTIVTVKEKVINETFILVVQFLQAIIGQATPPKLQKPASTQRRSQWLMCKTSIARQYETKLSEFFCRMMHSTFLYYYSLIIYGIVKVYRSCTITLYLALRLSWI